MTNVIVIDDDPDLCQTIARYLSLVGMTVQCAGSGAELDALLPTFTPDLVVLDLNLPGEDGFSIAARLRSNFKIGIVMLTARSCLDDRVLGLVAGADAYLVKPVEFRELEATIHSLIWRLTTTNRTARQKAAKGEQPAWGFDASTWSLITPSSHMVPLTSAEYRVLQALSADPGEPVSRESIAFALGKRVGSIDRRSIDSVIARLRRKVKAISGEKLPIRAVREVGYVFATPLGLSNKEDA